MNLARSFQALIILSAGVFCFSGCKPSDDVNITYTTNGEIYVLSLDNEAAPRKVAKSDNPYNAPAWSPDNSKLVFPKENGDFGDLDLFIYDESTSKAINLTNTEGILEQSPSWSPEGDKIAFAGASDPEDSSLFGVNVYVINADGTASINLTKDINKDASSPLWLPDGERIFFVTRDDSMYTIRSDGSLLTQIVSGQDGDNSWHCLSPDGEKVAFISDRYGGDDIFVSQIDGSQEIRLTNDGKNSKSLEIQCFSPDSQSIVYSESGAGIREVVIINVNSGEKTFLSEGENATWSRKLNKILFASEDRESLLVVNPDGSGEQSIDHLPQFDFSWWQE
ncbi:MAG: hypothetical protein AAGG51_09060 [Cyanobacteria bacterium P01_G01_bin.54]